MHSTETEQTRWFTLEVQPLESGLRSWLRGLFPSLPDVDDVVQESYLRLIRARQAGQVGHVKAYLFATARNFALDLFRRGRVVRIEAMSELPTLDWAEEKPDVGDAVARQQELELLADAVRALPLRCRQVMTMRLLYGMPHKQIAAELRISDLTVKAQIAKGMRRCANYLTARGVDSSLR